MAHMWCIYRNFPITQMFCARAQHLLVPLNNDGVTFQQLETNSLSYFFSSIEDYYLRGFVGFHVKKFRKVIS